MKIFKFIFFGSLIIFINIGYSSETMDTALQLSKGQIRAVLYYVNLRTKPSFQVSEIDKIVVSGLEQMEYFSSTNKEYKCRAEGEQVVCKVMFNPFNGLCWWVKAGFSNNYSLEVPSITVTNKMGSSAGGILGGLGAKYQVFPETEFNPGISLDLGITVAQYKLDRFHLRKGNTTLMDSKLEIIEPQVSFCISKRYNRFEHYVGFRISRYYSKLTDQRTFSSVTGTKDNLGIFVGTRLKLFPLEWLMAEVGFVDETVFSLGMGMGF